MRLYSIDFGKTERCVNFSFVGKKFFTDKAREEIEGAIKEAHGNEVFFVGSLDEHGIIDGVRVAARGNDYSTPAIVDSAMSGEVVIHNHPSGNLTPSDEDIHMAGLFGNLGVGFYIIKNDVSEVYVVVEPFAEKELEKLDIEKLKAFLLPDGEVSKVMGSRHELRPEQLEMVEAVGSAFNDETISLIEAGTGTGKTLAYLIPSIHWALLNSERVVISTNTINLQEQLIEKDIPLIHKSLGEDFKYSLVKGMGNYLCLLRAETVTDGLLELADDDEIDTLRSIVEWSKVTKDGSLSDLSFTPTEAIWDKVSAESESCLRVRCPHYSKCFFYKARREVSSSQILVVNHHLLFSDLAIKGASEESEVGILPAYRRVIFDEGHHIVDTATSHFGMRATKYGIIRTLRRLKRRGGGGEVKGLIFYIASLATKLKKYFRKGILNALLRRVEETLSPLVDTVENYVRDSFDELYYFALPITEKKEGISEEISIRITDEVRKQEGWERIDKKLSILRIKLKELEEEIKAFIEALIDHEDEPDVARVLIEFKGITNKLDFYSDVILSFLDSGEDGYVRWVEGNVGRGGVFSGIGLSPLDISYQLKEKLYSRCRTVVMTSATLAVKKSFHFIESGLGLEENERVSEVILPSPFNYKEQAFLAIPTDIPEPMEKEYSEKLSPIILEAVRASRGNALILFTSYSLLESVYRKIQNQLADIGIISLKQGSIPRARLLQRFKVEDNSALFATDSFWEGVDVPGEALRLVVITRLPFRVPTDPIIEARVENMEKQGINSFLEYSVPVAVLKFKQGFGRLIRTKTDRGAVFVLDKRIISKSYGKYFLESLPRCNMIISRTDEAIKELESFFGR
ncbi:MAG: DEAD/DEAH box helicase family protein [Candidatus Dadabacteria bacterium]|nr:DEAD/DEAH box helicase family protein [Candidatus Dadabacteria bacterium]